MQHARAKRGKAPLLLAILAGVVIGGAILLATLKVSPPVIHVEKQLAPEIFAPAAAPDAPQ